MNYRLIFKLVGNALKYEALLMMIPLLVSVIYKGDDTVSFAAAVIVTYITGKLFTIPMTLMKTPDTQFTNKEGFAAVALAWIFLSVMGAVPFYLCGYFESFADCLFESVSGFTTTGASILTAIEPLPRGILFWRSFTNWIGGMGVLVFVMALMPSMPASGLYLLKAESTGPSPDKFVPKIKETAKIMYTIYLVMTIIQIILLVISGMPVYDSLLTAFSTAGTGGFSCMNSSIGSYNNLYAEIITTVSMFLFSVNFLLYYQILRKNFTALNNDELKFYMFIVITATAIITINTLPLYKDSAESLRHASFQVLSVVTTTGYATTDFNVWPALSKSILIILALMGGCAGSTSGGIKMIRILLMLKAVKIELGKVFHPRVINTVKLNKKRVSDDNLNKIFIFFFCYIAVIAVSCLLISFESKDLISCTTAVIAAVSNTGPGLEIVGPTGNFSSFTGFSKIILSFCMLTGRLEIYPMLILFSPAIFRKDAAL